LPESVVSYGCGNPIAIAGLQAGEVVLDLGSGAGLDCFLAAQRVGPEGRVIGLDMTDEMLALAKQNKAKLDTGNVEFRKGVMEAMPLPDDAVDVIISNCVINLSPDKDAVFAEAFRVLRPGGRLHVSDVVLLHELTAAEQVDLNLWAGCIAGALEQSDYAHRLARAGFVDVSVEPQASESGDERAWRNATITSYKAGGERKRPRLWRGERLELIAPAGLEAGACCGDDCCSPESAGSPST
jgi:SAM-dependent methyltransferase